MSLNKTQIAQELANSTGLGANAIKHVLDDLAELAGEQLEKGEDFTVPGICSIKFRYSPAQAKGSRFAKGDTRVNSFTGEESVAEADSPAKKARIAMKLNPIGVARKFKPGTKPEVQSAFLKSKTGRAVVRRQG